jgi:hypothetical protein
LNDRVHFYVSNWTIFCISSKPNSRLSLIQDFVNHGHLAYNRANMRNRLAALTLLFLLTAAPAAGAQTARFTLLGRLGGAPGRFLVLDQQTLLVAQGDELDALALADPQGARTRYHSGDGDVLDLARDSQVPAGGGETLYVLTVRGLRVLTGVQPAGFLAGSGQALATQGGWVYVAAREAGVRVIDARDPAHPRLAATLPAERGASLIAASATSPAGYPLLLVARPDSVDVLDLIDPANPRPRTAIAAPGAGALALAPGGERVWLAASGAVQAYDLADPARPSLAGRYTPAGAAEQRVVAPNGYAYVADAQDGLQVIDLRRASTPVRVWSEHDRPAHDLLLVDGALVVGDERGLRRYDLADPAHPHENGALDLGARTWGLAYDQGRLFAATDGGLALVRADALQLVGQLPLDGSPRDVAVNATGTRAYVALADPGGLAVVDVRQDRPLALDSLLPVDGDGGALVTREGRVFLSAGAGGLHVVDVLNPAAPQLITTLAALPGESFGDLALGETKAYVAAGNQVLLVDVSNPKHPVRVMQLPARATGVALDTSSGFLATAGSGELHWIYVRPRTGPVDAGVLRPPAPPFSLALQGDELLVGSGTAAPGTRVPDLVWLDVVDPAQPRERARFGDGAGGVTALAFAGSTQPAVEASALFSAGYRGLYRYDLQAAPALPFDVAQPQAFQAVAPEAVFVAPVSIARLAPVGVTGLLAAGDRGWALLDARDPANLRVQAIAAGAHSTAQAVATGSGFVAAGAQGKVETFALRDQTLVPLGDLDLLSQLTALAVERGTGVTGNTAGDLYTLALDDPAHPVNTGRVVLPAGVQDVALDGDYAYVAAGAGGLLVVDLADESVAGRLATPAEDITLGPSSLAALSAGTDGVWLVDVRVPRAPRAIAHLDTPGEAHAAALDANGLLYVADGSCGLHAYDVHEPSIPRDLGRAPGTRAQDVLARGLVGFVVDTGELRAWRVDPAAPLPPPPAPANPQPDDGALLAQPPELRWSGVDDACEPLAYDVWLAVGDAPLQPAGVGLRERRWAAGALDAGDYDWQVVARDAYGGETRGPLWRFSIAGPASGFPSAGTPSPRGNGTPVSAQPAATAPPATVDEPLRADDGARIGLALLASVAVLVMLGWWWSRRTRARR